jgi:RNA polymerase sigma factor (sigma-70 family)
MFLGPALRAQPDRRLVKLVREGYETAFEEIVRRYRKPLDRFAAAIVGGHSEDVTQDAFSKALLALRGTTMEIELRPWLYRIVRNTALNDLRDGPPIAEELGETIPGGQSAAVEAERREEIGELIERLRTLPEPQRAAIVMRELEGLSHEEIAAALGVSGGAARQAIYRARLALRDGFGLLIPLPLLRVLFDHGTEAASVAGASGVTAAGAASVAGGGAGATVGGFGAAGALKVGLATALLAGSVGAGVAMQHDRGGRGSLEPAAAAARLPSGRGGDSAPAGPPGGASTGDDGDFDDSPHGGSGSSPGGPAGHGGRGSGHRGRSGSGDGSGGNRSGEGISGGSHSGRHGSGEESGGGSGSGGSGESGGGEASSGGSRSGGSGSGDDGSHGGEGGS